MITKKVIDTIYKRYKKRPKSPDDLNIALLFEGANPGHNIEIIDNNVHIGNLPEGSPFQDIPITAIHAIIDFEEHVAIVLHSSILFLNKKNDGLSVHIKPFKPSIKERLTTFFNRNRMAAVFV